MIAQQFPMSKKVAADRQPFFIGVTGFEPATSRPPAVRATKLRHTPSYLFLFYYKSLTIPSNLFKIISKYFFVRCDS